MLTPCELKKCIYLYPQQNEIEANDFLNMFKTVARKLQIRCSDNRYDITFLLLHCTNNNFSLNRVKHIV